MIEHPLTRDDVDLAQLAAELGQRLGRAVALSARLPEHSPPGEVGALTVSDVQTGELLDTNPTEVAAAVAAHRPPASVPDPLDVLESALATATTPASLRVALLAFVQGEKRRRGVPAPRP